MAFIELPTADLTASTFKSKAKKWVETPGLVDLQVNGLQEWISTHPASLQILFNCLLKQCWRQE